MDNEREKVNKASYKYSEDGIRKRNIGLWESITNYIDLDITFKEKFYLFENNIISPPKCNCGSELKFIDMSRGYREFCSRTCMVNSKEIKEKRKESCIKKWGVDNPSKVEEIREKVKKTNREIFGTDYPLQAPDVINRNKEYFLEKWGVDNPSKVKEIREKANNTIRDKWGVNHIMLSDEIKSKNKEYFLDKWGVDNPSKVKEVRERAIKTMIERWGVDSALKNPIFLNKLKRTSIQKWGVDSYTKTDDYRERLIEMNFSKNSLVVNNGNLTLISSKFDEYHIKCSTCLGEFTIQRQLYRNRIKGGIDVCLNCNPISLSTSIGEKNILKFIRENYSGDIIENYKGLKKEIDIYLPELNLGFEFNGLYWHSELHKENSYHYTKYKLFKDSGINLMTIWEDDWKFKEDIIKSMILNRLKLTETRIFARKCVIREVDGKLVREFLGGNHIQGFVGSRVKLGLFHEGELVSLMTFGSLRRSLGNKSQEGHWELLRFCNKINSQVVGGGSKLFKYFLDKYNPLEVTSYSLNTYSTGKLYENLDFEYIGETTGNYFWCKQLKRYHRFNFRKDKLVKDGYDPNLTEGEIMYERGYFRVFDSGSKKYIYKKSPN
jgi:hypothetical protein